MDFAQSWYEPPLPPSYTLTTERWPNRSLSDTLKIGTLFESQNSKNNYIYNNSPCLEFELSTQQYQYEFKVYL